MSTWALGWAEAHQLSFLTPSVLVVQKEQKFKGKTQKFRLSERKKKIQRKNNEYKEDQKIQ